MLQTSDDPMASSFNTIALDLTAEKSLVQSYHWDGALSLYTPREPEVWMPFLKNSYRRRKEFIIRDSFESFLSDAEAKFTHPDKADILLDDLFVYPDLRQLSIPGDDKWSGSLVKESVPEFIRSRKRVLLMGEEKSGKTALAKMVFRDLFRMGLTPVYVLGSSIKDSKPDSIRSVVERAFTNAYQSPQLEVFRQLESKFKAVIVDDFHTTSANAQHRDRVLRNLTAAYGVVVVLGAVHLRFDSLVTKDGERGTLWEFTHCEILPFGHRRLADLVGKWHLLGTDATRDESELAHIMTEAERIVSTILGQDFIPHYPIYILIILQQIEAKTRVSTMTAPGASCSYLYEALLSIQLASSSKLDIDLDTQYSYLSEFAYHLYSRRTRSVSRDSANDWHLEYCQAYDLRLNFDTIIGELAAALVLCAKDGTVSFRYPYLYYYFVARYFRDHINEADIRDSVTYMTARLHHTESANIVMFLTYLSKDEFILSSILEAARRLFAVHPQCDLAQSTGLLAAMMDTVPPLVLDSRDPELRRREVLALRDESEQQGVDRTSEELAGELDDFGLDDYLRVNVAYKTIEILGQVLRNFPGSLKRDKKLDVAEECYSLGLRVLQFMLDSVESALPDIVELLADFVRRTNPKSSASEIVDQVKLFLFNILDNLAFAVVRHISDSVGLDALSMTYETIMERNSNISYRFIDLSIHLDHFSQFPGAAGD